MGYTAEFRDNSELSEKPEQRFPLLWIFQSLASLDSEVPRVRIQNSVNLK